MSIKLVSVNIEGNKHLGEVGAFLQRENPDVVCLMEASELDIRELLGHAYPYQYFAPNDVMGNIGGLTGSNPIGVMMLSKKRIEKVEKLYFGMEPRQEIVPPGSGTHAPVMLCGEIEGLQIGVVHFTWTPRGSVTVLQSRHLQNLIDQLEGREIVMCGDFNIPRGNENYQKLLTKYRDNVPMEIETTIDPVLHYANKEERGKLKTVVDYIWSTSKYRVENVEVGEGVSDHCALVATVILSN